MTEVGESPLMLGQSFPSMDIMFLRVVEYANLYGVRMSEGYQYRHIQAVVPAVTRIECPNAFYLTKTS